MFWCAKAELNLRKKLKIFEGLESIVFSSANILCEITLPLLNDANEFIAKLRRFSQSKFHFDFEDDSATGTASPSLLVPLFAKNSRLGYFLNANNLRRFSQSKFHFDFEDDSRTGIASLRSLSRYLLKIAV